MIDKETQREKYKKALKVVSLVKFLESLNPWGTMTKDQRDQLEATIKDWKG